MRPRYLESLQTIADYLALQQRFATIGGYLMDAEGYALAQIAAYGGGTGAIVELGSFLGRSTAFLAHGAKAAGREQVVAVDHFRGSPEHQPGGSHAASALEQNGTTFPQFQDNLRRVGLADYVKPVVAEMAEAARGWQGPIRLLFIDGDHAYEACKRDFELWSPHVTPHGLVCFHDFRIWPGVTRFVEELLQATEAWHDVATILSLKVIERKVDT
jgi:predicted O-methyltransferase YrrM